MTDQYAVFGNPIAQSQSPAIHAEFARQTGQQLAYRAILAPKDNFIQSLEAFFADDYAKGCNVTLPFKEQAALWATEQSERVKIAGAANTIIRNQDGGYVADNTDGVGLVYDLKNNKVTLADKRILLIGAGGAAKGVVYPLLNEQPGQLVIANRSVEKAQRIADSVAAEQLLASSLTDLTSLPDFDIIINSTSASLSEQLPGVDEGVLGGAQVVYDMVYGAEPTIFMRKASELGVETTLDGLGMLVGQAAQSFYLWRGVMPNVSPVLSMLRNKVF